MNRNKQIAIFAILIFLLSFSFMRLGDYYWSKEDAFYATERGGRYGPSCIVGEYATVGEAVELVGIGEGYISQAVIQPVFGFLWKSVGGGCRLMERKIECIDLKSGRIVGLSLFEEVQEVFVVIKIYRFEALDALTREEKRQVTMTVDENGYFTGEIGVKRNDEMGISIQYLEGRDKNGETVYRYGTDLEGKLFYE